MIFYAHYASDCGACDVPIKPDDACSWLRVGTSEVVVHAACPEPAKTKPPCTKCWLVHAGECL